MIYLVSNVIVSHLAQYSVGFRAGRDRVSEIWACEKTQARQHCFDSKRYVTKQSRATFPLLSVPLKPHFGPFHKSIQIFIQA